MLIHPWDQAARDEWRGSSTRSTSVSWSRPATSTATRSSYPRTSCTTATRPCCCTWPAPTRVWRALEADPHVVLALTGDYAYVEAAWNANPDRPGVGVPTSYYTGVQLLCRAEVVDDPDEKAAILARQLGAPRAARIHARDPSPTSRVTGGSCPHPRPAAARRAVRAKMKYGGNKTPEHRARDCRASRERAGPLDQQVRDRLLGVRPSVRDARVTASRPESGGLGRAGTPSA